MNAVTIVQPETIIRWHRTGFRLYWRWKSRSRGGRPKVPVEIRRLIREMSLANRLWGAPRIHGELLKLGIEVAQSTVAKYMARSGRGRSQTWKTFLHNHAAGIGAMDFLVVPTINFRLLFVLAILRHERRRLISLSVTLLILLITFGELEVSSPCDATPTPTPVASAAAPTNTATLRKWGFIKFLLASCDGIDARRGLREWAGRSLRAC